jgi:2-polyprenyl-6-methoxyphenol hydroxylase-like FAD-dependent oxidoreductase
MSWTDVQDICTVAAMTTHVLISGASIAGPALAHWLHRYGFAVTVVERAPTLRPGGQAVDLRGVAKEAVRRMGLIEQVRAACTDTRGMSIVNSKNQRIADLRADMFGGDGLIAEIEILRGDLAETFYRATADDVEYVFGDQITELEQHRDRVEVGFAGGERRSFDLVVGADGLHSALRAMVFRPEQDFLHDLGYLGAFFTVPNHLELDSWMLSYSEPKRAAAIRAIHDNREAMALMSMPGDRGDYDHRDVAGQKALLRRRLSGMGWEVPWLLDRMDEADDFYFDSFSQVHMDTWSAGRVVLLGDAVFCATPMSGQGTSLAVVGAYLLATELADSRGDHGIAFAEYERKMRGWVESTQKMGRDNAKRFTARNRAELWLQHQLVKIMPHLPGKALFMRQQLQVVNGIELPDPATEPRPSGGQSGTTATHQL